MEEFTEELKREYFNALYNLQDGNNTPMSIFKNAHKELYDLVNKNYHKRKILRENIYAMRMIDKDNIVFGALTFDEEHDKQSEETKRKQARRHLDKYMRCYLYVEELGEDKERYHIHFIGIMKPNKTYMDFNNNWHSRRQIEKVIDYKRTINYLTNYVSKQAPRIRRSKELIRVFNHYKKSKSWRNYGFETFAKEEEQNAVIELVFDL